MPCLRYLFFFILSVPAPWLNLKVFNCMSEGLCDVLSGSGILGRHHIARYLWFECSLPSPPPCEIKHPAVHFQSCRMYEELPVPMCLNGSCALASAWHWGLFWAVNHGAARPLWKSCRSCPLSSHIKKLSQVTRAMVSASPPTSSTHQRHPEGEFRKVSSAEQKWGGLLAWQFCIWRSCFGCGCWTGSHFVEASLLGSWYYTSHLPNAQGAKWQVVRTGNRIYMRGVGKYDCLGEKATGAKNRYGRRQPSQK